MAGAHEVKVRILKLDPHRINDPVLLNDWDQIWERVSGLRSAIARARSAKQVITVDMMQEYEQARNSERQFFWDHFYEQDDT